jgi:hypothetical protein
MHQAASDVVETDSHPYYLRNSMTGGSEGFSTLDGAREALLGWIFLQRQSGETVVETDTGQWHDSKISRWITDREDNIVRLDP